MSNKRARCDPIDFRVQLQEGSGRIALELSRSTPLTADQRQRVLSVRVLGDTVPAEFFKGCHALTDVEMGTELVRIGHSAFESCHRLQAVRLPDTVTEVGSYAFHLCRGLESVRLPARMRRIPIGMFDCCDELRRVTFPEDLEEIGESAFEGSDKVGGRLPATLRWVGEKAFSGLADLGGMFPHVKLRQCPPPDDATVISAASVRGMHPETALLRLKIRALGKGAGTVFGVSCQAGGAGVCAFGCILDARGLRAEA
jgi:hypothetical protein